MRKRKFFGILFGGLGVIALALALIVAHQLRAEAGAGLFDPTPSDDGVTFLGRIGFGGIILGAIIWPWRKK